MLFPSSAACKRRKGRVQSGVVNLFSCSRKHKLVSEGEVFSVDRILPHLLRLGRCCLNILHAGFLRWTKPLSTSLLLAALPDLGRSKSQLRAENALLRRQLIILSRQVKRPAYRKADRLLLVLLARLVRTWQQAHITRSTRYEARAPIVSSFAWSGSTGQRPLLISRKEPQKPSHGSGRWQ